MTVIEPIKVSDVKSVLAENRTIDLGIFGSFWLQTAKPIEDEDSDEDDVTHRPEPVFRIEQFTDKYPEAA